MAVTLDLPWVTGSVTAGSSVMGGLSGEAPLSRADPPHTSPSREPGDCDVAYHLTLPYQPENRPAAGQGVASRLTPA